MPADRGVRSPLRAAYPKVASHEPATRGDADSEGSGAGSDRSRIQAKAASAMAKPMTVQKRTGRRGLSADTPQSRSRGENAVAATRKNGRVASSSEEARAATPVRLHSGGGVVPRARTRGTGVRSGGRSGRRRTTVGGRRLDPSRRVLVGESDG